MRVHAVAQQRDVVPTGAAGHNEGADGSPFGFVMHCHPPGE